ncbi:MAG: hypothetical protein ACYC7J_04030 [Syntrophales bacterium]
MNAALFLICWPMKLMIRMAPRHFRQTNGSTSQILSQTLTSELLSGATDYGRVSARLLHGFIRTFSGRVRPRQ